MKLECSAANVLHDQVHSLISTKKILYLNNIGMADLGKRPALFEKALKAMQESSLVLREINIDGTSACAQRNPARQIFFNSDQITLRLCRKVNDAKTAGTQNL